MFKLTWGQFLVANRSDWGWNSMLRYRIFGRSCISHLLLRLICLIDWLVFRTINHRLILEIYLIFLIFAICIFNIFQSFKECHFFICNVNLTFRRSIQMLLQEGTNFLVWRNLKLSTGIFLINYAKIFNAIFLIKRYFSLNWREMFWAFRFLY